MRNNKKLKFKKKLFFGVDEIDVLKKFKALNEQYKNMLIFQKESYEETINTLNERIRQLENKTR